MKPIFLFFMIMFFCMSSSAQHDSSARKKTVAFKFGVFHNTHLNYYGRTDSLKSTGTFPLAEFWVADKFYLNAAPVFISNRLQTMDYAGTVATMGYLAVKKKWISHFYITKPFYETNVLVQSALKGQANVSFTYLNKLVNISAGADVKLSDQVDAGITAGLDHLIKKQLKNNSMLILDPTATIAAGTQRFTQTYKNGSGLPLFPQQQEVKEEQTAFNILAYEFSLPLIFVKNKWMLLLTPSYVIPQNLVSDPVNPGVSEEGKPMMYATAGIKYSF